IRKYGSRSPLFVEYFYLIFPLTISIAFLYLFEAYSWAVKRSVLPAIAKELMVRILTTGLIILVMLKVLNFKQFINLYALIYIPPVIFLIYSLAKNGDLVFHFTISSVTKRLKSRIVVFSLFLFSGQALNILARTLDSIIISSQSSGGLQDTGIFTIATYFIALMEVPVRSMVGIAFAVLVQAWKDKNKMQVFDVYRKTALNLLVAGLGIMGVLILDMPNIILHLGPKYQPMMEVVLILGFSKLIDLGTGLNSHLLLASKHWRIEFTTNIFLVLMAGVFNYLLVRKYGIIGSAWATLISFAVYNALRFFLIWKFFRMQPFTAKNFYVLVIAGVCFFLTWLLPAIGNIYVDSFIRAVLFIALYGFGIIRFNISADIQAVYKSGLTRLQTIISKSK
ncbi:MAG: polysaccharide biosynthesis C-terminal domain-containing protein, partial [Bacteroidota bacterium]